MAIPEQGWECARPRLFFLWHKSSLIYGNQLQIPGADIAFVDVGGGHHAGAVGGVKTKQNVILGGGDKVHVRGELGLGQQLIIPVIDLQDVLAGC